MARSQPRPLSLLRAPPPERAMEGFVCWVHRVAPNPLASRTWQWCKQNPRLSRATLPTKDPEGLWEMGLWG